MVFKLFSTLASNSDSDPRDVRNVKSFLGNNGFIKKQNEYDQYPDSELFGGIRKFQRKNGLKIDGVIKPNGETETAMGRYKCSICGGRHDGLYSPSICHKCYEKLNMPIPPLDGSWGS